MTHPYGECSCQAPVEARMGLTPEVYNAFVLYINEVIATAGGDLNEEEHDLAVDFFNQTYGTKVPRLQEYLRAMEAAS